MARWHVATCRKCNFQFHGGHSHHSSSEGFLCLACASVYALVTENEFGATPNERVPIFRLIKRKKSFRHEKRERVATGATAFAVPGEQDFQGKKILAAVTYDLCGFICDCGSTNFTFELADKSTCPSCTAGILEVDDVIY